MREHVTITIHRAQDFNGREIPVLKITAVQPFPDLDLDRTRSLHEAESAAIVEALVRVLPGGTIDRVLAKLLAHQASGLIVAHRS